MTNDECRAEALRLAEESKASFAECERLAGGLVDGHLMEYWRAAHQRQLGALYAALTDG